MKILVHADARAIPCAAAWARALEAEVTVLRSASSDVSDAPQRIRAAGLDPNVVERPSDWLRALRVVTRARHYDLAITGANWRRTLWGRVWGDVPDSLLQIRTNLLIVREGGVVPHHILAGIGTGPARPAVVNWAIRLAEAFGAKVTPVHVAPAAPLLLARLPSMVESTADFTAAHTVEANAVTDSLERLRAAGLAPELRFRQGEVEDEILAELRRGDYDLVLLGSSYAGRAPTRFMMEHVTGRIVRHSPQPVLLVHAE